MYHAFLEQATALAEAGADLLSIETMYDLREAVAAVRAARTTGLPVLACMTFEARRKGFFTIMGDPLVRSLGVLAGEGADAAGFNCTVTAPTMELMVEACAGETPAPLIAQPNAGQPRVTPEGIVYDADPREIAERLLAMVGRGVRVIGGCCGTGPEMIRLTRRGLAAREAPGAAG